MVRPVDIIVLLSLIADGDQRWTVRSLAERLRLPPAAVQRSLSRLGDTPVFDQATRRVSMSAADDLFAHALPFIVPATLGAPARGMPTAWGAAPLVDEMAPDDLAPVWPDAHGAARGLALDPLHPSAVALAREDPGFHELLALVDAIRVGRARERHMALVHLRERLFETATSAA